MEEEMKMTEYIVKEKLPNEIDIKRKEVEIMSRIAIGGPPTQETLDQLNAKIEEMSSEVKELMEKKVVSRDSGEETFRQQANIIARKKEEMAERFGQAKQELGTLSDKLNEGEGRDGLVLNEEEYKEYINKVKVRGAVYRSRRASLGNLVAESGVLARTLDLLNMALDSVEPAPPHDPPHLPKERLITNLAEVNQAIAAHKAKITPALQELRSAKEKYDEVLEEYNDRKRHYDTTAATLESGTAKLEQEVKELLKEKQSVESEGALTEAKTEITEALLERAQNELSRAASKGSSNTLRERLNHKIAEEERLNKELKEKQKEVKESQERHARQRELWSGIKILLECKEGCLEKEKKHLGRVRRDMGAETLVLD